MQGEEDRWRQDSRDLDLDRDCHRDRVQGVRGETIVGVGGAGTGLWLRESRLGGAVGSAILSEGLFCHVGLIEEVLEVI